MRLIKPQQRSVSWLLLLAGIMISMLMSPVYSQSRTHDLGDFKYLVDADDAISTSGDDAGNAWPQDHYRYWMIHFYNTMFLVGSWTDETGGTHSKETIVDPISFNNGEGYGVFEYRKHEPPEVWVTAQGKLQLSSKPFDGEIDPNLPADQMIELHYKAYPGFDVVKKTYSYTNENHDDYIIFYNRFLCTFDWDEDDEPDAPTDQTISDMYISFGYTFQKAEGTWITFNRWYEEAVDDWATYEAYTPTLTAGRDLHITYGWDGDHPDLGEFEVGGQLFDDTGDPRFAIGEEASSPMPSAEFISNEYAGFAALHADASPTDRSDDITQPTAILTNINIYNVWDSDYPGYATAWDWAASGYKQTVEDQSGWPDDPSSTEAEMPFQAFGPYDFTLGDSVVIVYAVAVNGISTELAIEKGLDWRDWYRGVAGADFDDDAKNDLLATGKDSLFQSLDRALYAWNNNLSIPSPLPAPDLTVTSGPNVVYLEWEDMSQVGDPNTGVADLDHYNIYRKQGSFLVDTYDELREDGSHQLWEKIDEVDGNTTQYTDDNVVRGQSYHYAVTAVDDGTQNTTGVMPGQKLESSKYANRSQVAAIPFLPGEDNTNAIKVVPNPYIIGGKDFNFDDDNQLLFVNLPPYCTLRIYTATGDLINTIEHSSGSADEIWDQVTESTQYIASGVYILQVADAQDINRNSLPDSNVKFVIIR